MHALTRLQLSILPTTMTVTSKRWAKGLMGCLEDEMEGETSLSDGCGRLKEQMRL